MKSPLLPPLYSGVSTTFDVYQACTADIFTTLTALRPTADVYPLLFQLLPYPSCLASGYMSLTIIVYLPHLNLYPSNLEVVLYCGNMFLFVIE